tara:strand:+ start:924 stop:1133 length:210 start_codon:yes stop_codon:yes gene_type:complete
MSDFDKLLERTYGTLAEGIPVKDDEESVAGDGELSADEAEEVALTGTPQAKANLAQRQKKLETDLKNKK